MAYRVLAWFLRLVTRVFFRQIEVEGLEHVPADGPVIFVGNHPNSLLDPILIITSCGRKVHFAAKDTLFKNALMRAVLGGLGAVPIARRVDHGGAGAVDNDAAFTAMFGVLGDRGALGIFPEGISHDESQLQRLKTGAARVALGAVARGHGPVQVVPCGLTFINPKRFRSRVLVQYGPPITVDAGWQAQADADGPAAARALTVAIEQRLRALTINADDWDTLRTLDVIRRLYQPAGLAIEDRVELARRFNTHYPAVADHPRVQAVVAAARAYQAHLDATGLTDRELARDLSTGELASKLGYYLALVLFWLPLTVPGLPLHLPTVVFARFAGKKLTPRKDVVATTKVVTGILMVLVAYAAAIALLAWRVGPAWAAIAAVVLPLSGIATLRVLDRVHLLRRGLGVLRRRLRLRAELAALRAERAEIVAAIVGVVDEVKPEGLELRYPQGPATVTT
ncbi:MAG: lysophospholipid acyltransferase family protein [Kofleriaceae bacterium]